MSDEQRESGRDAGTPTDGSRTEQYPVPAFAGAPAANEHAGPGYGAPPNPAPGFGHQNPGPAAPPAAGPAWGPGGTPPIDRGPYPTAVAPVPQPHRKQRTMTGIVAAALIAGVVGGGAGFGGAYALLSSTGGGTSPQLTQQAGSANSASLVPGSVGAAAAKATPSTVDIQVRLGQGEAEGSGVILTADGNVLTNNHVVAGATGQITVTMADGSQHQATVVGTSPSYDLAVIKVQGVSGLTPATLGESSGLQVGQPVVAIGSPQGLTGTVTTGIISAFNRTVAVQGSDGSSVVYNGLQTDAPINHGNSGGPLVNLDGQVVGINSAIAAEGSTGLGFAIPIDQAKRVAQELMSTGTATKPMLGVEGQTGGSSVDSSGAQIAAVQQGSPAATAGLAAGDVVTKVGDTNVQDFADLVARIGSYAPGQKVTLTVQSGGTTKNLDVTLGSQPDKAATTSNGGQSANPFGNGRQGGQQGGQNNDPFGGGGIFGGGN